MESLDVGLFGEIKNFKKSHAKIHIRRQNKSRFTIIPHCMFCRIHNLLQLYSFITECRVLYYWLGAHSTNLYRGEQGKFDDASAPTFLMHGNCRENKTPLPPPPFLPHGTSIQSQSRISLPRQAIGRLA